MDETVIKRSRVMYVIQAALEYFISLLVAGSYLATLTSELGISDSLTGILSSFISLGCVFQLFSVFLKRKRVKGIVTALSVLNQLLFLLLYIIPLAGGDKQIKIAAFMVAIFLAYLIYNCVHPLKINWLMSLVEDEKRGIFTSWKEIVSLVSGMIFSFVMGAAIDRYKEEGRIETAFLICGVTIFVLLVLHTLTMLFAVELPEEDDGEKTGERAHPIREMIGALKNKTVLKITIMFCLWHLASGAATPFYGTYLIKELGFSLKFVSVLNIVYSVVRALLSPVWGVYADKRSFAAMIRVCLGVAGLGFLVNVFTVPANGAIFYTVYYVLYAVAMAGINSALTNLVFDYVDHNMRSNALAVSQALSGLTGFLVTLVMSALVSWIQENGNSLFGLSVYAQQVTSAAAFLFTIVAVIYVTTTIIPIKRKR